MPHDQSLQQHYHLLLGLDKDWEVQEVKLSYSCAKLLTNGAPHLIIL